MKQTHETETLNELMGRLFRNGDLYRDAQQHPQRYVAELVQRYAAQAAHHGALGPITRYAARVNGHQRGCICARCSRVRVAAKRFARQRGLL